MNRKDAEIKKLKQEVRDWKIQGLLNDCKGWPDIEEE